MDLGHQTPQLAQVLCKIRQHQHLSVPVYAAVHIAVVPAAGEGDIGLTDNLVDRGAGL
jgi:hypothetical protein